MKDSKHISFTDKITLLSFTAAIFIVYIHSLWSVNNSILNICRNYIFNIQNTCVPIFFMISGYLFYRSFTWEKLIYKYKSRVKSLLIPYIIWNIISFAYSLFIKRLGAEVDIPDQWFAVIYSVLNANYSVLWFVKYLMIFTVAAPIIYMALNNAGGGMLTLVAIIGFNVYVMQRGIFPLPINLKSNSIYNYLYEGTYYLIGCYAGINMRSWCEKYSKKRAWISTMTLAALLAVNVYWVIKENANFTEQYLFRIVFGISIFFAMDLLMDIQIHQWMKTSFFIYCVHMYPLQLTQQLLKRLFNSDIVNVLSYLTIPAVTVLLCIFTAKILTEKCPRVWSVLTGNRGAKNVQNQRNNAGIQR